MTRRGREHRHKPRRLILLTAGIAYSGLGDGAEAVALGQAAGVDADTAVMATEPARDQEPEPMASAPSNESARGVVYDGLEAAPKGVDITKDIAPVVKETAAAADPARPASAGDGSTGMAVELWGGRSADGTLLVAARANGYAHQQWLFEDAGGGLVRIKSTVSGEWLQTGAPRPRACGSRSSRAATAPPGSGSCTPSAARPPSRTRAADTA